jgi:hypothetical protein
MPFARKGRCGFGMLFFQPSFLRVADLVPKSTHSCLIHMSISSLAILILLIGLKTKQPHGELLHSVVHGVNLKTAP